MSIIPWLCSTQTSRKVVAWFFLILMVTSIHCASSDDGNLAVLQRSFDDANTNFSGSLQDELLKAEARPHSRQKRLVWITDDGRLALPPGTVLSFTPSISMPLVRHPPEGFTSNLSMSFPVTINFDKLGLTDNQNPLGDLPPFLSRSFGHSTGEMLANYLAQYIHFRRRRSTIDASGETESTSNQYSANTADYTQMPQLPKGLEHIFHGGERVQLYAWVEEFLSTFGMDGRACLLRTICEVQSKELHHFGFFGEILKLFLTASNSPFSDLLPDHVKAQEIGKGHMAPGECFPYHKDCPNSLFRNLQNHRYQDTHTKTNDQYYDGDKTDISSKWMDKLSNEVPLKYTTNDLLANSKNKNLKSFKGFKAEKSQKLPVISM